MIRFFLFIILVLISVLSVNESHAAYIPGSTLTMTGSNGQVRFDMADTLYGYESLPAFLSTTDPVPAFSGAFYGSGIGWIAFANGTNQVKLDCGGQPLANLDTNCSLTGTGWSETIGDINFYGVIYNPHTGLLIGSATSYMGNINLSGISLPLRPAEFTVSEIAAHHSAVLTISGSWRYDSGNTPWKIRLYPIGSVDMRDIGGSHGAFTVDLSLATSYEIEITDTNGSQTTGILTVTPNIPSIGRDAGHYSDDFCKNMPTHTSCPDDNTRLSTTLTQIPPAGPVFANGSDAYAFHLKMRDTYGNRIDSGNIKIKYTTTVKNIQTDPFEPYGNMNYGPSIDGDAFTSDVLGSGLGGSVELSVPVDMIDLEYRIASTGPTDTTDNVIKLDSIRYTSGSTDISISPANTPLDFDAAFSASVSSGIPTVNAPSTFSTKVHKNDPSISSSPTIITTLRIGDGLSAKWGSLSGTVIPECTNYPMTISGNALCGWDSVSVIATRRDSDFNFSGTYTPITGTPPLETSTLQTYIHYTLGSVDILYPTSNTSIGPPTALTARVRVLGQSGEGVNMPASARVRLTNDLREQVAIFSRNRASYDDVDYLIVSGDYTITSDTVFAGEVGKRAKRTIVSIGGNIRIEDNIALRDHPITLIALTDRNNQGGNIIIGETVSDIHGSLIAEHAVRSDKSNSQLYIHGSILSSNPIQDTLPTVCPYFVNSACIPSDYDLPGARSGYAPPVLKSQGGGTYAIPLVIEMDPRSISDPAPMMSRVRRFETK